MRLLLITIALCMIAGVVNSQPAKEVPKAVKCATDCTLDYKPLCAGPRELKEKPTTFGNRCVLDKYNCEHKKDFTVRTDGECPGGTSVRLQ